MSQDTCDAMSYSVQWAENRTDVRCDAMSYALQWAERGTDVPIDEVIQAAEKILKFLTTTETTL